MQKRLSALVRMMPVFFLFTACSGRNTEKMLENLQSYYQEVKTCSVQADVTADFGDSVSEFRLLYEQTAQGEGSVTVLAPESIKGIRATWNAESGQLAYEDVALETGVQPDAGISPVHALPLLLKNWAQGYVSASGYEKIDGADSVVLYESAQSDGVQVEYRTWFDEKTFQPLKSEIYADGRLFIQCDFEQSSFE